MYSVGLLDLRRRWHETVPVLPHMSLASKGCRYTLIYFMPEFYNRVRDQDRCLMDELGFRFPDANTDDRFLATQ